MSDLQLPCDVAEIGALDAALRSALGAAITGVTVRAPAIPVQLWAGGAPVELPGVATVHFAATPTDAQTASVQAILAAHDPVLLAVDKTTIQADGADEATVTVQAANPVTLLVNGAAVAVDLTDGVGVVGITASDPDTISVTVQNGTNRCAQQLTIQAV